MDLQRRSFNHTADGCGCWQGSGRNGLNEIDAVGLPLRIPGCSCSWNDQIFNDLSEGIDDAHCCGQSGALETWNPKLVRERVGVRATRSKGNRDDRDFRLRQIAEPSTEYGDCVFCERPPLTDFAAAMEHAVAVWDAFPVTEHHVLILPLEHVASFDELPQLVWRDMRVLVQRAQSWIQREDPSVTAFNVGMNLGRDAGQTIDHLHLHVIPRRSGDVDDPTGGVRGVIPSKKLYRDSLRFR